MGEVLVVSIPCDYKKCPKCHGNVDKYSTVK
jgi:hypothetical protein